MSRHRQLALSGLAASALALGAPPAAAADDAGDTPEAALPALIAKLGSDSYATRQIAQARLQELAGADRDLVLGKSLDAYLEAIDPEVRVRLRSAMFGIVAGNLRPEGFIGIRMTSTLMQVIDGLDVEQVHAVQILTVLPDTAAAEVGLRPGDYIVKLDGEPFDGGLPSYMALSNYVRSKTSGDSIALSIKRGGQDLEIDLELGARPESLDADRRQRAFAEWLDGELVERGHIAEGTPEPAPPGRPAPRFRTVPFREIEP